MRLSTNPLERSTAAEKVSAGCFCFLVSRIMLTALVRSVSGPTSTRLERRVVGTLPLPWQWLAPFCWWRRVSSFLSRCSPPA